MRIGIGYDVHKLVENRKLIIGGATIPHEKGLDGHSAADVLVDGTMDSLLGALAMGDIGKFFPDTDMKYKDVDSMLLLKEVASFIDEKGYKIGNIDSVIIAQQPKMAHFIDSMRVRIAQVLEIDVEQVGVKATTTEHLGFEGRKEGISSSSVAILFKK